MKVVSWKKWQQVNDELLQAQLWKDVYETYLEAANKHIGLLEEEIKSITPRQSKKAMPYANGRGGGD